MIVHQTVTVDVAVEINLGDVETAALIEEIAGRSLSPTASGRLADTLRGLGFEITQMALPPPSTAARFRSLAAYLAYLAAERAAGRIAEPRRFDRRLA